MKFHQFTHPKPPSQLYNHHLSRLLHAEAPSNLSSTFLYPTSTKVLTSGFLSLSTSTVAALPSTQEQKMGSPGPFDRLHYPTCQK